MYPSVILQSALIFHIDFHYLFPQTPKIQTIAFTFATGWFKDAFQPVNDHYKINYYLPVLPSGEGNGSAIMSPTSSSISLFNSA